MSKRRRNRNRGKRRQGVQSGDGGTPAIPEQPLINLGFLNAHAVQLKPRIRTQIVVAGCGGIGAYMVMHIGRLMRVLYDNQQGVNLTLVDPDIVSEENLGRQLFCDAEKGEPKALALMRRYGQAFGLNNIAYVEEYSEKVLLLDIMDLIILVGCVDNSKARVALHETLMHNSEVTSARTPPHIWWLDCGNAKDTGRVMLGSAYNTNQLRGAFTNKKKCLALPSPGLQYPSLMMPEPEETNAQQMSCAELQMANMQSLNINAAIAVQAADFLTRLLVTEDLKRYQCAVNLASGSVKSIYCTPEDVAREIGENPDFVTQPEGSEQDAARDVVMQRIRAHQLEQLAGDPEDVTATRDFAELAAATGIL